MINLLLILDFNFLILLVSSCFAIIPFIFKNDLVRKAIFTSFIICFIAFYFLDTININYPSILFLVISGLLTTLLSVTRNKIIYSLLFLLNGFILFAIYSSFIVPIERLSIFQNAFLSMLSGSYTIGLNLSKIIAGYTLIYLLIPSKEKVLLPKKLEFTTFIIFYLISAFVLIGIGFSLGYLKLDFKLPTITPMWFFTMLFFVCIPEELFYRRYIQKTLEDIHKSEIWKAVALIIASIIFGLAHYNKGISFVVLSFIAGLLYGRIYQKTGSLFYSILLHLAVNLTHFLFFTYP